MLLLEMGSIIGVDRLLHLLWDNDPPNGARRALHAHVARLRAALATVADSDVPRIVTVGAGYALDARPEGVDAFQFRSLVSRARAEPKTELRAMALRQALDLWRGPVLAGSATDRFRELACDDLEELRLLAEEDWVAAELDLGHHAEVVAKLRALATSHPYRERVRALLMIALYRSGRQIEALQTFRTTRAQLIDELGVEPTPPLQRLHEAMLHADERLTWISTAGLDRLSPAPVMGMARLDSRPSVPRELPADLPDFTGRIDERRMLDELLPGSAKGAATVAIIGPAGSGKTALAVHWAHLVADHFPDGQLYLDLHGHAPAAPLRPVQALASLLRSLGVPPDQVPATEPEAAALFRSLVSGRSILMVLDNGRSAEQIRPLLPGSLDCLVVVTGRKDLGGLVARDGARLLRLHAFTPEDACGLVAQVLEAAGIRAAPDSVAELASLCGYLPLALRVAMANLVDRTHPGVVEHVENLWGGSRLAALDAHCDRQADFELPGHPFPASDPRSLRMGDSNRPVTRSQPDRSYVP
jgi:DNA-binding SARP family transcriptional activator